MTPQTEHRYILRNRAGADLTHPSGKIMTWPSYMAALRGRAIVDCTAHIIQQELIRERRDEI